MSRADLVDVYISGLNLTAVSVVCSGGQCRIYTDEPAPNEKIKFQFYFRPTHADLVLMTIGREGLSGTKPAALAAAIERAAAMLGAPFRTADELRRVAEQAVDEVQERVTAMRQNGGLKEINADYKRYRQQRVARAEPAVPYSAYLQRFTEIIVARVAAAGRI